MSTAMNTPFQNRYILNKA